MSFGIDVESKAPKTSWWTNKTREEFKEAHATRVPDMPSITTVTHGPDGMTGTMMSKRRQRRNGTP